MFNVVFQERGRGKKETSEERNDYKAEKKGKEKQHMRKKREESDSSLVNVSYYRMCSPLSRLANIISFG